MKAFFFDMDGILFDSMPNHSKAWEEIMARHGLTFTARECYINEGRTGEDVIQTVTQKCLHRDATKEEILTIYKEKSDDFLQRGETKPIPGVHEVLKLLQKMGHQLWIVTGSGQQSLFDKLEREFPTIFTRDRMVTAYDVEHGKPSPEPYLTAWERSGLQKSDCYVIENAPLGVRSGKSAGLFTIAVNTGILSPEDLFKEDADQVFDNMQQLKRWIIQKEKDAWIN